MLYRNEKTYKRSGGSRFALARQITIEYYNCDERPLLDKGYLEKAMLTAAEESGATIVSSSFNSFAPQGISGVVIIAESHFTVHAWPEHNYAAVDMFTCGDIDLDKAVDSLQAALGADRTVISADLNRGLIPDITGYEKVADIGDSGSSYPFSWGKETTRRTPWGLLSSVDIRNCNPETIRSAEKIENFVAELCDRIAMKRYGNCQIIHFGEDEKVAGYSMTQLIETSLVSGHFANASNTAYIDVFSCKFYEPRLVAEFALSFFEGADYKLHIAVRQ
ncbi:MAG: adenosylmethionine decarboxylase [Desulfobacterales bacterium]|nr:adenosylmethionine decarboxylase [Desulfobacterales bacterium]